MAVIRSDKDALILPIIKCDHALRCRKLRRQRAPHRLRIHPGRIAEPRPHQIHIVNRVIQNLQSRRRLQKAPQLPRHMHADRNLHIVQLPQRASLYERPRPHHVRSPAQLKVHRCYQPLPAAHLQNLNRLLKRLTHRLLQQHRRTIRQLRQNIKQPASRYRHIEHRVLRRKANRLRDRAPAERNRELLRQRLCFLAVNIYQRRHRKPSLPVSRQVRVMDDPTRSNHDDWQSHHRLRRHALAHYTLQIHILFNRLSPLLSRGFLRVFQRLLRKFMRLSRVFERLLR